jgi:DNA-binding XRE family transcriptional regulator
VRYFVFRDEFDGFRDWIQSIDKIYAVVRSYDNTTSDQYRESIKEKAQEARKHQKLYLELKKLFNENQLEYMEVLRCHHTPSRKITVDEIHQLIDIWSNLFFKEYRFGLIEITNEQVGDALRKAREHLCMTKAEVAGIIGISQNTYKCYEDGRRTLPFDIYFKLQQFLKIEFEI